MCPKMIIRHADYGIRRKDYENRWGAGQAEDVK